MGGVSDRVSVGGVSDDLFAALAANGGAKGTCAALDSVDCADFSASASESCGGD